MKRILMVILPSMFLLSACSIITEEDMKEVRANYETEIEAYEDEIADYKEQIATYEEQIAAYEESMTGSQALSTDDPGNTNIDIYNSDYETIYQSVIEYYVSIYGTDNVTIGLVYLNDDSIPELFVYLNSEETLSIYTVTESLDIVTMMDSVHALDPVYYEGCSIVGVSDYESVSANCEIDTSDYYLVTEDTTIFQGDIAEFGAVIDAVIDNNGNWTGDDVITYYCQGEEITMDMYIGLFERYGISENPAGSEYVENNTVGYTSFL